MSRTRIATVLVCTFGTIGLCASGHYLTAQQSMPQMQHRKKSQNTENAIRELPLLMRAKLSSSQKIVEGLMSADFAMIRKGAQDLQGICDATQWRSIDDQVYAHYRAELKRSALKLVEQSDLKSLDGTAYSYMHSMTTCIHCHEYCRNVLRLAESVGPSAQVVPIPVTEQENAANQMKTLWR